MSMALKVVVFLIEESGLLDQFENNVVIGKIEVDMVSDDTIDTMMRFHTLYYSLGVNLGGM